MSAVIMKVRRINICMRINVAALVSNIHITPQ